MKKIQVQVHCFEGERKFSDAELAASVHGYNYCQEQNGDNGALRTLGVDLQIAQHCQGVDLVHSHTWYANMAGYWAKLLHQVPHVVSAHSLEPLRPWKREQLGGGYNLSSWAERSAYLDADAIIAVSQGMAADIQRAYPQVDPEKIHVIHNGLDLSDWQLPTAQEQDAVDQTLQRYGIQKDIPTLVFLGRITRQKGLPHLLQALKQLPKGVQVVLCAGAPDTKEIAAEVDGLVKELQAQRQGIILIGDMLPHQEVVHILSAASVFVTPSIYEPMGIVNLEAAAMELPVVGTDTGGIPDCIVDGETGYLVPIQQLQDGSGTPTNPQQFHRDLAERLTDLLLDPAKAKRFGQAGRARVEQQFTWDQVGQQTIELYRSLL